MILEEIRDYCNPYVSACFQAMLSICDKLKRMQNADGNIDEQNYVIELASSISNNFGHTKFLLGGELKKEITSSNKAVQNLIARINNIAEGYNHPTVTVKPDYVIHYNVKRENLSEETQKMVIEAKTKNHLAQDLFSWDLYKLGAYVNELSYQTAIYLILNTDKNRVDALLAGYKEQGLPEINDPKGHLFFFIQDSIDSVPKAYTLVCDTEHSKICAHHR